MKKELSEYATYKTTGTSCGGVGP
jgi:hypothetical protein